MSCDNVQIKYTGNGSTTRFVYSFEVNKESDLKVAFFDDTTNEYSTNVPQSDIGNPWSIDPGTNDVAVLFTAAVADGQKFKIYRETDIVSAVFAAGSAIRARDLNDNFDQIEMAIEEGRCETDENFEFVKENFWNKQGDTIYTSDDWVADDDHIASTGAIQGQFDKKIDKGDVISRENQTDGNWLKDGDLDDDDHLASAAAISERHDPFFQPDQPTPVPTFRIPGRRWFDNDDARDMVWDQSVQTWIDATNAGPVGPQGPEGTFSTIVSDDAPTVRNNGQALQNGDVWFNSRIGESFVWYMDGTSNQWVSISPAGPEGPQGIEGPQGPGGAAQTVIVSDAPPALNVNGEPVVNGDLWFNSANGILYTRYDDTWVSTSLVGPAGEAGETQTVIISEDPPRFNNNNLVVENGDLWFNSANGILYTRFDGTWVSTSLTGPQGPVGPEGPPGGNFADAPADGTIYGRQNNAWVPNAGGGGGGGIPEAPLDGEIYGRQNGNWVTGVVTGANLADPLQLTAGGQVQINLNLLNATP